jgi:4-aminobutyrate aminotransferase-like enzyme
LDSVASAIQKMLRGGSIGAILVEPIQGRGGINVPPPEFLPMLRQLCNDSGTLLILDEIYTGFGRTGRWFACEHSRTIPDILCLGKALTGGFPLSACVGRADVMDAAWPPSTGEAIHTSTFLGHPVGCAMALAQIREIRTKALPRRCAALGKMLLEALSGVKSTQSLRLAARGIGLMAGLELNLANGSPATARTIQIVKKMLRRGFILLPEGEHANVLSFTPPLTISPSQLDQMIEALSVTLLSD